jgi:Fic family protein
MIPDAFSWPSVGHEPHPWSVQEHSYLSNRDRRAHSGDYQAAVVVPISAVPHLDLPSSSAAAAEEAAVAIGRFDADVGQDLAGYGSLLLRSESAASSKIEQLTASARSILIAEATGRGTGNAATIVANTRATQTAIALADTLDEKAILDMHETLLGEEHPEWVGHWREEQVWVGGRDAGPHLALFVPPHHRHVPDAMADLMAFVSRDDLPAFAQTAIAHAQFETIHPFPDGNGRTGRALVQAMLKAKGIARQVTVPVSAGLLADVDEYFAALTAYR